MNDIFEEYLREKEPEKKEKSYAWHTAIGLQAVDGINTARRGTVPCLDLTDSRGRLSLPCKI